MEHEIWKDIEGYENLYRISNIGRVQRVTSGRILRSYDVHLGYLQVHLCKDGKVKNMFVHRLVAMAFIPNPDNLPVVNHKDRNPSNNKVDNLEWCTQEYNSKYADAQIRKGISRRKPIIQLSLNGEFIREWESATIASKALGKGIDMTYFEQIGKDYLNTWLDKQEYHSKAIECSDLCEAFVEGFKFAMLKAKGWVEKESASSMAEENGKDFIEYMMEE